VASPGVTRAAAPGTPPQVVVEFDLRANQVLKARLTRRLIAMELGEVDVPARPDLDPRTPERSLFVRVLGIEEGTLLVEIWEQGELYGQRKVSVDPAGSQTLSARRIAMATAELARRMRRRRLAEAKRRAREAERRAAEEAAASRSSEGLRLAMRSGLTSAAVGPSDFWLVGPELDGALLLGPHAKVQLGMGWLFGGVPALPGAVRTRWFEVSLTPSYGFRLNQRLELDVGATAAAAAVHLTGVAAVDDVEGQIDTWSARAAARFELGVELSRLVHLQLGPQVGAVLRRVVVEDQEGRHRRLGGPWLGFALSLTLDPASLPVSRRLSQSPTPVATHPRSH
jgi:hypothetical protein